MSITAKIPSPDTLRIANCPDPNLTPAKIEATAPQILRSMGAQSCSTKSTYAESAYGTTGLINLVAGYQGQKKTSTTDTVGCEQIAIQTAYYLNMKNSIACITNRQTLNTSLEQKTVNSIKFIGQGDNSKINISCTGNLSFDQEIRVRAVTRIEYTDSEQTQIADLIKNYISNTMELAANSQQGFQATPQGQKLIFTINQINQSSTYIKKIKEFQANTNISYTQSSEMLWTANEINLTGTEGCSFKQANLSDIITSIMVDSVLSDIFKSISDTTSSSEYKADLKSKNEGVKQGFSSGSLIRTIIIIIVCVVLFYFAYNLLLSSKK